MKVNNKIQFFFLLSILLPQVVKMIEILVVVSWNSRNVITVTDVLSVEGKRLVSSPGDLCQPR